MFKVTQGETIKFSTTLTTLDAVVSDPSTGLSFSIKDPQGNTTSFTYGVDSQLEREAEGKFSVSYTLSLSGTYIIQWKTLPPKVTIVEDTIIVTAPNII